MARSSNQLQLGWSILSCTEKRTSLHVSHCWSISSSDAGAGIEGSREERGCEDISDRSEIPSQNSSKSHKFHKNRAPQTRILSSVDLFQSLHSESEMQSLGCCFSRLGIRCLPGQRLKRTGMLLSGPKSFFHFTWKSNSQSLEGEWRGPESSSLGSAGVCTLCFIGSKVSAATQMFALLVW